MKYAISGVLVLVAVAAAVWFWRPPEPAPKEALAPQETATSEPAESPGPRYPVPALERQERPALRPLPDLNDSDEYFRLELGTLLGEGGAALLQRSALIERFVAAIDNLPRQSIAARVRPLDAPEGAFEVDGQDGSGEYQLSTANYRRYDLIVNRFTGADSAQVIDLYQRFYPLFQRAYEGLGYPAGYFHDRLLAVIDHLLATPDVQTPVMLLRPHVLYEFSDESLQALSAGQKLMIRIGPAHRQAVGEKLIELRELLAASAMR